MKVKVAHICTARSMYRLLEDKLVRLSGHERYEVHIISSPEGEDSGTLRAVGVIEHKINMSRSIQLIEDMKSLFLMVKLLKTYKFDIIHTHNSKAGIIGRIAGWATKTPLIIHTTHGLPYFEGQSLLKYNIYKLLELLGSKFCHIIASQNREDLTKLGRFVPEKKLFYEGNGVDLNLIDRIKSAIFDNEIYMLKERYKIPYNSKLILVGARFEPVKNHELLIEALQILKKLGKGEFCCLIAGEGYLRKYIEEKVINYGLWEQVRFLGYQAYIFPWIKMSDLLVLVSKKEGIPRILMEGMAFGKPVAATNVLGTRELVENNKTGLLSECGDAEQLAKNISLLLEDEGLRTKMGNAGRKRIENHYNLEIVMERIYQMYG